ncbi:putative alpha-1,2-mannosidase [Mucilaginibacter gracilis]|uniref:Putative alpha-1,2-mannosidase n=1 Tax=Mucilaginibacter gracilis TaxID=423350 RepID=A0A495J2G8_9SPHI|nr:GH92 family glycosyl hydrolase [Mucilaginibacter gracilis]RKR83165.1 putative alpha-1,2-mannosidase [Mucilaginibacter gracilis]
MKYKYFCFLLIVLTLQATAQKKKPIDHTMLVNPFIGTGGHGHTYPGATVPFGMVQLSPDTRLEGWDGCSGYHYSDTTVYGFSHTHLSGTGIADYCDILFMPTTGDPKLLNTQYSSGFKKKNEQASPGWYHTKLDKYNIDVELTATRRVGVHKYIYPGDKQCNIIIDLKHRDEVIDAWIEVVNDHEIRGLRRSKSWADDQYVYFYAKFSKPFKTYGIALNDKIQTGQSKVQGTNLKMYIQFDNPGEVVSKVGISSVSTEGALKNLDTEVADFDFKRVQKAAKNDWLNELAKIDVEGGATAQIQIPQPNGNQSYGGNNPYGSPKPKIPFVDYAKKKQTIFYTALYHTLCAPNVYSDVDGQYRGLDKKIHKAEGFDYYTVFSLWDTYRAQHPLQTIINRKRTLDFIKSFLAMYDEGGLLPIWPLASSETYCMVGNHSIPVIVDAYAKGIRDFDAEKALTAMKAVVNRNQFGLDSYRKNGAVLAADEEESVSKTLEYAIDDWCIAQMAKMMNKPQDYAEYIKRGQYWKNVFDNQSNFMRARSNGGWFIPFLPTDVNNNYTEGNSWQYSFLVPQDVQGLIDHMGGKETFEAKLEELFTTSDKLTGREQSDITGLIGQYAHGNEPSHHMAYLFNFTDNSYKTQLYVSRIMREQYKDEPDGLAGNEDCGQMSAWYVMSALGFYTIAPGQQDYQIGLPLFDKAVINLENGKKFTITGTGNTASSFYLQGMTLNKNPYEKLFLTYNDIANGGDWEVFSGKLPNKLFMQDLEKPVSKITDNLIVANPYIIYPSTNIQNSLDVSFGCADANVRIYYTLDGSAPTSNSTLFTKPVTLTNTTTVKCIAIKDDKQSFIAEGTFTKIRGDVKVVSLSKYHPLYNGGGTNALIDGFHGTTKWRMGNWQAFQGNDLEVVLDLGQSRVVKKLGLNTLQDSRAWIVFPKSVEFMTSDDGKNFKSAGSVISKIAIKDTAVQTQFYGIDLGLKTRYLKIIAHQYGPLPDWHESKGKPSYIFADEIVLE